MRLPFLQNKAHSFTIAKIAIVFQSVLTVLVGSCLLTLFTGSLFPQHFLVWLVYIDGMFVILHLSYRAAYRGPQVILQHNEKKILLVHIMSSLVALCTTSIFIYHGAPREMGYILGLLFLWCTSLISGVLFFKQKYYRKSL